MGLPVALTTARTRRIVSIADTAIDRDSSELDDYETSYDVDAHLAIVPGQDPVYFHVRALSRDEYEECQERSAGAAAHGAERFARAMARWAFRLGVKRIEGLAWEEDGKPVSLREDTQIMRTSDACHELREEVCERIPDEIQAEIGFYILHTSRMSDAQLGKS